MSVNGATLLGLSHNEAVQVLKRCAEAKTVILTVLHGIGDSDNEDTFIPTWKYWLSLPRYSHICMIYFF